MVLTASRGPCINSEISKEDKTGIDVIAVIEFTYAAVYSAQGAK